jgi:hypothetical protein
MRRRAVVPIVIVAGIFGLWMLARAQEVRSDAQPAQRETLDRFMRRKLDLSARLLEKLATGRLAPVAEAAQSLSLLCLDEDWNLIKTPEYAERSADFRRTANAIDKAAREENLPAAQLAYVQLVGQCFSCHEFVRDLRKGK